MNVEVKTGPSLASMAQNMYRVGDFVYIEQNSNQPYAIRKITELTKTPNGTVEAKVVCFYRRREVPTALLKIADRAERQNEILLGPRRSILSRKGTNGEEKHEESKENGTVADVEVKEDSAESNDVYGVAGLPKGAETLDPDEIHQLRQHELFMSRQIDVLQATQIRGKCNVVMLNEVETTDSYLSREDAFFYSLVFDTTNQTLLADKGKIDVGDRHQADIPDMLSQEEIDRERGLVEKMDEDETGDLVMADEEEEKEDRTAGRKRKHSRTENGVYETKYEQVVYHPHHELTGRDIDQFLIIARAVGTFSRALDASATMKLPSVHTTAAAASRDVTLLHAMAILHQAKYDIGQAVRYLVPPPSRSHYPLEADKVTGHNTVSLGGPILCRDQLEEWSASEATLFEEAIDKCGKDFHDIRNDCLPWKALRDIVEYYYMWKTTSRYAEHQKAKLAEQENKLKQVYIPNYNKPLSNVLNEITAPRFVKPCESCKTTDSGQWYSWGPQIQFLKLCQNCWQSWKKHGGLKSQHEFETYDLDGRSGNSRTGGNRTNGTPARSNTAVVSAKGRNAFYLNTIFPVRVMRKMAPKNIYNSRKAARSPTTEINDKGIYDHFHARPLNDVYRVARLLKPNNLPPKALDFLSKSHVKKEG